MLAGICVVVGIFFYFFLLETEGRSLEDVSVYFADRWYLDIGRRGEDYSRVWKVGEYSTKTDDYFPYADCPNCYWTGYFVSRTGFKKLKRVVSSFLLATRQVEAFSGMVLDDGKTKHNCGWTTFPLEDASRVAQHHDAITETAKQHVDSNYIIVWLFH